MNSGHQTATRTAVTGASGLIGSAVTARLTKEGHAITRLVRSREAAGAPDAIYWDAIGEIDRDGLRGHDVVIHLAAESPGGLWTPRKKRRIRESRIRGTSLIARTIAELPAEDRPAVLICASASGYYGDRPRDRPLDESDGPGSTFMADIVRDWEAAADPARAAGIRVVHTRFGGVFHPDSLLLELLAGATRLGLAARIGSGEQVFPWVTRREIAGVVPFLLRHPEIEGPVNVVAPERTTNRQVADTLARVLRRPRFLWVPAPLVKLGGELGRETLRSVWMVPKKLEEAGYTWRDPSLEPALRRMLTEEQGAGD